MEMLLYTFGTRAMAVSQVTISRSASYFISNLPGGIKEITLISDGCNYQI